VAHLGGRGERFNAPNGKRDGILKMPQGS